MSTKSYSEKSYLTLDKDRIVFWGSADDLKNCRAVQRYNDKKHCFEFPILPGVVAHLKQVVPNLVVETALESATEKKTQRLIEFADLKKCQDVKGLQDVGLKDVTLFGHQNVGARMNELFNRMLVLDQMGLGKTMVAIRTALYRLLNNSNQRCLIICPNSIKNTVWAKEIQARTNLGFCVPYGTKARREKIIKEFLDYNKKNPAYHFLIVNYEMTYKYQDILKEFVDGQMLIIDESHYMKSPSSQRTKAIFKMSPLFLLSLTGTPLDNRVEDVYTIAEYVCPLIFGGSHRRFEDRYCVKEERYLKGKGGTKVKRKLICGYKNLDELKAKLDLISYRRRKSEVLDLPPKTYENRHIIMSPEQWKYYEAIREECYLLIQASEGQEIEVVANGILGKMLRLSQVTDGYITDFANKEKTHWIRGGGKLAELDGIIEQVVKYEGEKIVIWSRFVEVVKHLKERYSQWNAVAINGDVPEAERADIVDRFQMDDETKIFIGQIQSCGVGMTLNRASVEVFYDKCFLSASMIMQAEDRIHRIGMDDTKSCTVISLIAKGTIDEHWENILVEKLASSDDILDEKTSDRGTSPTSTKPSSSLSKNDYLSLLLVDKSD